MISRLFKPRKKIVIHLEIKINGVSNGSKPVRIEVEDGQLITIDQPVAINFEPVGQLRRI